MFSANTAVIFHFNLQTGCLGVFTLHQIGILYAEEAKQRDLFFFLSLGSLTYRLALRAGSSQGHGTSAKRRNDL